MRKLLGTACLLSAIALPQVTLAINFGGAVSLPNKVCYTGSTTYNAEAGVMYRANQGCTLATSSCGGKKTYGSYASSAAAQSALSACATPVRMNVATPSAAKAMKKPVKKAPKKKQSNN